MSNEIDHLRERRRIYFQAMRRTEVILKRCRALHEKLEKRFTLEREMYEITEHRLAILDGRKTVIPQGTSGKSRKPQTLAQAQITLDMMSLEQIQELSRLLADQTRQGGEGEKS